MQIETIFLFISFCGLIGIFLRRNLLNITVSFLQIISGVNCLIILNNNNLLQHSLTYYIILFFAFLIIMFIYAVMILLIRRRSTLQANELTEMRG